MREGMKKGTREECERGEGLMEEGCERGEEYERGEGLMEGGRGR